VQVLAAYTNPESHNAQHAQTDGRTDGQQDDACVSVRSAKNLTTNKTNVIKSIQNTECLTAINWICARAMHELCTMCHLQLKLHLTKVTLVFRHDSMHQPTDT